MKAPAGLIGAIVVALFGVNLVTFTVNEVEQVIVTQFGEPVRVIDTPGLYFKLPSKIQFNPKEHLWMMVLLMLLIKEEYNDQVMQIVIRLQI